GSADASSSRSNGNRMVASAWFCDAVIGRPLETAHRQVAAWRRRDGVPSRDFERCAPKNLDYFGAGRGSPNSKLKPRSFPVHDSDGTSGCRTLLATKQLL